MSNSNKPQPIMNVKKVSKLNQIKSQSDFIKKKKEEILEKQKTQQLVNSLKVNKDERNVFSNDGSFLENFKKISEQAKQQISSISATAAGSSGSSGSGMILEAASGSSRGQTDQSQLHIQGSGSPPQLVLQSIAVSSNVVQSIPVPTELDLNAIPNPILKLDEIRIPDTSSNSASSSKEIPNVNEFIEMVAENDENEDLFIRQTNDTIQSSPLWFLLDKNSDQYREYRNRVVGRRRAVKEATAAAEEFKMDTQTNKEFFPKTFGSTEVKTKTVNIIRNEDSDSTNSDTEYMKEAKERNLKNMKNRVLMSWKRTHETMSTSDSDTDCDDDNAGSQQRFYLKFKNSASSSSSSASKQPEKEQTEQQPQEIQQQQHNSQKSLVDHSVGRPPKRKKSRWGPSSNSSSSSVTNNKQKQSQSQQPAQQPEQEKISVQLLSHQVLSSFPVQAPQVLIPQVSAHTAATTITPNIAPKLTLVTRSDPALLNYARQNFGSTNLSEEDWKKAEEHFKINLLYQDMLRKRQEIDQLAKSNKFKHEYDSDEDIVGGTWEHKLRSQEMEATAKWAEALTKTSEGKHHIGDFLPPEELRKFMEKYNAQKNNRQPDISDYKEYKLKEDNIGFQMLQKLGWKQGQGLGVEGNGIVEPVNKATQRDNNQGLGVTSADCPEENDNEYDAYRKRMMLAYRFRPNPLNNPRRAYY